MRYNLGFVKESLFGEKGLLKHRLVKAANLMFIMRIFALVMSFVTRIILARILGEEGLGSFQYAISWMEVLMIFTLFGQDRFLVREISAADVDNRPDLIQGVLRFGNTITLIVSLVLMLIAVPVIMQLKGGELFTKMTVATLLISPLILPLRTNMRVRQAAMQALNGLSRSQIPEFVVQPILFIGLFLGTWWLYQGEVTPVTALILYIVSILVTVFVGFRLLVNTIPDSVKSATPSYQVSKWLIASLPLILLSGMNVINNRLDILMLGAMDSVESVGIYTTATQLANILSFVLVITNTALAPSITRLYRQGNLEGLQSLVTKSSRLMLLVTSLMAVILFLAGPALLKLFGEGFVRGTTVLNFVILGQLVNVFFGSVGILLTMTENAWYPAIGTGISAICNIILNILLIPSYGMNGAAFVTFITYGIWNVLLAIFVWRKLGIIATPIGKFWK